MIISGYCRIKFRFKKLFYIWLICALVGGACYSAHLLIDNASLGRSVIYYTVFCISNAPGTWFIQIYIFLLLLSPFINALLDVLSQKQWINLIVAITIISIYFGWFWGHYVNKDGYGLLNFVWLYVIGAYLSNNWEIKRYKYYMYFSISICCAILNAILFVAVPNYEAWTYNNPLVVISSIAFFLFMMSFDYQRRWINWVAESTLVVYLVHENAYISRWLYSSEMSAWYSQNLVCFFIALLLVYCSCCVIDFFLRRVLADTILNFVWHPLNVSCHLVRRRGDKKHIETNPFKNK